MNTEKRRRIVIITVVILLVLAVAANRFVFQPLRRMVTADYLPAQQIVLEQSAGAATPAGFELVQIIAYLAGAPVHEHRQQDYRSRVDEHFDPWRDHPAVGVMEEQLAESGRYDLGFSFGLSYADGSLIDRERYASRRFFERTGFDRPLLEDFARRSRFAEFYRSQKSYYRYHHQLFTSLVDLEDIARWLGEHFEADHQGHQVLLSPLSSSLQYGYLFRDRDAGYSKTVINVPPVNPRHLELYSLGVITREQLRALSSLEVFTELAHHYVNPATDRLVNRLRIARVFGDWEAWHAGSGYQSPTLVFNEYLTWGLYLLYCNDRFGEAAVEVSARTMEEAMERRGFLHFSQFTRVLLAAWQNREAEEIEEIYGDILAGLRDAGPLQ